jgi:hypothetical protein
MVQGFIKPVRNILSCLLKNDSKKKKKIATPQIKQIHKFLKTRPEIKSDGARSAVSAFDFRFLLLLEEGGKKKKKREGNNIIMIIIEHVY